MRLFLSGVSCVGKTTIGKLLAQEIGFKFFDLDYEVQYSKPLAKMDLTESEKIHYLREISLDLKYFGRFYSKANYRIKVAGRSVDEVVQDIRMTLKL